MSGQPLIANFASAPLSATFLFEPMGRMPRVHFLTAGQTPVSRAVANVTVSAVVTDGVTSASTFSCASQDLHDVAFTLEAERLVEVCRPVLSVNATTTDDQGVATFKGFSFVRGPPGTWTVEFSSDQAVTDSDMVVSSALSTIVIDGSAMPPESFVPGQPLTVQPRLQLLSKSNSGAAGRSVVAFVAQSPYVTPSDGLGLDVERHDLQGQRYGSLLVRWGGCWLLAAGCWVDVGVGVCVFVNVYAYLQPAWLCGGVYACSAACMPVPTHIAHPLHPLALHSLARTTVTVPGH